MRIGCLILEELSQDGETVVEDFGSDPQKRATQPLVEVFFSTRAGYARLLVLSIASVTMTGLYLQSSESLLFKLINLSSSRHRYSKPPANDNTSR